MAGFKPYKSPVVTNKKILPYWQDLSTQKKKEKQKKKIACHIGRL